MTMHGVAFGYARTYQLDAVVSVSMLPGSAHLQLADSGRCHDLLWSTSVKSATYISPSNGLYHDIQVPSYHLSFYGSILCV